ncbi:unnamed protein product [Litomosoides sigmodontis]|uniref:Uncharacterized protein n=1 Tax=Litomosoides sigmodontis TaxID=42156 RepID=A0A3P6V118_LITSI|nr:unnamed protein product [Litomosoides sigmodontis]
MLLDYKQFNYAFHSKPTNDVAMCTILSFLPRVPYWIAVKSRALLDHEVQTVHVPITFRKDSEHIYSADCAENNCDMWKNWAEKDLNIRVDGSVQVDCLHCFASRTACLTNHQVCALQMLRQCDTISQQFHVVSIFCLEQHSSENLEGHRRAVRNTERMVQVSKLYGLILWSYYHYILKIKYDISEMQ